MSRRCMIGALVAMGLVAVGPVHLAMADPPQYPGTEYVFTLDDANSILGFELLPLFDDTRLQGWISVFLEGDDPNTARLRLGDAELVSLDSIDLIVWAGVIEAHIYAGDLQLFDFDIWYQDPNEWDRDPNMWPDPNDAQTPNDADDPNDVDPWNDPNLVDPNDPNFNSTAPGDPNDFDPNYSRWVDLVGGSGTLNSEMLFFWRFTLMEGGSSSSEASTEWSRPFGPWDVKLTPTGDPNTPVRIEIDWTAWVISGDYPTRVPIHLEGVGGPPAGPDRTLTVSFYHGENGTATFSPDPLSGADPNTPRVYTDGTPVTLTAVPNSGKIFLKWKVQDANEVLLYEDSNLVTLVTMDQDYNVEAQFKCGSSVPPFVAFMLLALAAGVIVRRLR